jgi:hypothetical protein
VARARGAGARPSRTACAGRTFRARQGGASFFRQRRRRRRRLAPAAWSPAGGGAAPASAAIPGAGRTVGVAVAFGWFELGVRSVGARKRHRCVHTRHVSVFLRAPRTCNPPSSSADAFTEGRLKRPAANINAPCSL